MTAKILVVEDEPAIQELLAFNIAQCGHIAFRHMMQKVPGYKSTVRCQI